MPEASAIIRASSLAELFDCAARWKAKHIDKMWSPSGAPAAIGTAVHAGTAVYDTARMEGRRPDAGDAVDAAAMSIRNPEHEVQWDDMRPGEAIDTAARLTLHYCNEIAQHYTYDKVEMACDALDVQASNGLVIRFTGHVDRRRVEDDKRGVVDFKTGRTVLRPDGTVNTQSSGAQLATYELLELMMASTDPAPGIGLLPALIIAMPTAEKKKPAAAPIYNAHRVLIGDEQHKGLIDDAADMLKYDIFPGNPRSMLCSEKYCPAYAKCRYRFQGE